MLTIRHVNAALPEIREQSGAPVSGRCLRIDVGREDAAWRERLEAYGRFLRDPVVDVADPCRLSRAEHRALSARLDAANMALYRTAPGVRVDHASVLALGRQFGLSDPAHNLCAARDAVSDITPRADASARYVPYTRRALSWHTDGYYESGGVRSFILHCIRQAASGGANRFLDHEILHGLLARDVHVDVGALYDSRAFVIPANIADGIEVRGAVSGAVFETVDGALRMRYTARRRHICWKDEPALRAAKSALEHHLARSPLVLSTRLEPGMGIVCRNVPHCRDAFTDEPGAERLLLRARYPQALSRAALSATARDLA